MSSIHRFQATWRQTTFNPHYDNSGLTDDPTRVDQELLTLTGGLVLDAADINRVSAQDYRELRQYLEGAEPNEAYEGVRAINLAGRIFGGGATVAARYADLEDRAWLLSEQFSIAACRLAAASLDPKGVLPFDFRRASVAGVKQLRFYARPGPARPVWMGRRQDGIVRPFSAQLVAFDPFAVDVAATNTNLANLAGGNNTVANPGNIYTLPKIVVTFSGAAGAAVTLANTTTGQSVGLNLATMAAGQTLTIDVRKATIVRDNGSNQFSRRLTGFLSSLFLLPGNNTITWSAAAGVTQVQFQVRGAYA